MRSPLLARLYDLASRSHVAIEDERVQHGFAELLERARAVRATLCAGADSLEGRRVALLGASGAAWVEAFFAILLGGGVALPLSPLYPASELGWFMADAGADTIVVSAELRARIADVVGDRRVLLLEDLERARPIEDRSAIERVRGDATAMLLYTSGTTGKPKGAMLTHDNIAVQAELIREAWGLDERDTLLHVLPLHHLHGLGISLLNTLLAGAKTRMLPRFEARRVWEELASGTITVWMAVPTIYQKLFEAFDAADDATRERWARGAGALRLSTSGSAALPVTLASRWQALTGAIPLERFGMTEIGVGASNPLVPSARRAGTVGTPLRSVEARIVDEKGHDMAEGPGELLIRGPSVFKGYWEREEATRSSFTDGWFRTGDVAERSTDGYIRLLGRTSVDILKSGGYKLSALEIEEALRENDAIAEVAVVGVPDETWGDKVFAVVVPRAGREAACEADVLRAWARERLAPYKVPREVIVAAALPRNALGKVVKPDLVKEIVASRRG